MLALAYGNGIFRQNEDSCVVCNSMHYSFSFVLFRAAMLVKHVNPEGSSWVKLQTAFVQTLLARPFEHSTSAMDDRATYNLAFFI